MNKSFSLVILLLLSGILTAQEEKSLFLQRIEEFKVQPIIGFQLWTSYTNNAQAWNTEKSVYEDVDNRLNFQIRRIRFGWKAQPYENLSLRVVGAYDLIGRDIFAGTTGGQNNGNLPSAGLWDAYAQWRLKNGSEALYLTAGYFVPQFSRESFTSAFAVTSISKAWSQNYIRRHISGRGPGRTSGLNLGGLWQNEKSNLSLKYNLGIHNPTFLGAGGNTVGQKFAPLLVGRVALSIGDAEETKYTLGGKMNYLGKRRGITLATNVAQQGETDLFTSNTAIGFDLLFNWDNFNLDAERVFLSRSGRDASDTDFTYRSETLHLRASYNFLIADKYILEPSFQARFFTGSTNEEEQIEALLLNSSSGIDNAYVASLNWYITASKLKLSLSYTLREGEAGEVGEGLNVNQLYTMNSGMAMRRGDWLGLGLIFIL